MLKQMSLASSAALSQRNTVCTAEPCSEAVYCDASACHCVRSDPISPHLIAADTVAHLSTGGKKPMESSTRPGVASSASRS